MPETSAEVFQKKCAVLFEQPFQLDDPHEEFPCGYSSYADTIEEYAKFWVQQDELELLVKKYAIAKANEDDYEEPDVSLFGVAKIAQMFLERKAKFHGLAVEEDEDESVAKRKKHKKQAKALGIDHDAEQDHSREVVILYKNVTAFLDSLEWFAQHHDINAAYQDNRAEYDRHQNNAVKGIEALAALKQSLLQDAERRKSDLRGAQSMLYVGERFLVGMLNAVEAVHQQEFGRSKGK